MENMTNMDELQHWGIKGMRWGERRYQNKDGTLTPAGKKRYDKEVANLKKETEKLKAAEKIAENKRKTQAKFDRLDAKKQALEERKAALKGGKGKGEEGDNTPAETPEQKKARLLKSSDPKELYENRDMLTNNELNDRINRIDMETRLQSKIPAEEQKKSGVDYMNEARTKIEAGTNLFKAVDGAYSAVMNSAMGKTIAKKLGLDVPKEKEFDIQDFWKNRNKKTTQEIMDANKRITSEKNIKKTAEELGIDLEDVSKKVTKGDTDAAESKGKGVMDKLKDAINRKKNETADDSGSSKKSTGEADDDSGNNKSSSSSSSKSPKSEEKVTRLGPDDYEIIEPNKSKSRSSQDFEYTKKEKDGSDWVYYYDNNTSLIPRSSSNNTRTSSVGQNYVAGLLEDKSR